MAIPINAILEASIIKGMTSLGNYVANQARSNASWSSTIPNAISVGQVTNDGGGKYSIIVKVDAKVTPEALAFEFGSGIHNPDNPGTYVIAPKRAKALAFFWDKVDANTPRGPKFRGISPTTGKAIFNYVDHPGVAARPYFRPAVNLALTKIPVFLGDVLKSYKNASVKVTVIK